MSAGNPYKQGTSEWLKWEQGQPGGLKGMRDRQAVAATNSPLNTAPVTKEKSLLDELRKAPKPKSLIDKKTGLLGGNLALQFQGLDFGNLDSSIGRVRDLAGSSGYSPYAMARLEAQKAEEAAARDVASRSSAGAAAEARAGLATRGGISSGARERLARDSGRMYSRALQDVARQGTQARLGIGADDASFKQGLTTQLPGMELQSVNARGADRDAGLATNRFNIEQAVGEQQRQDQAKRDLFEARLKLLAADRQATAEEKAAEGGATWLCSEVNRREPLSIADRRALAKLIRIGLRRDREATKFYVNDCHELTRRMNRSKAIWPEVIEMVQTVAALIEAGSEDAGYDLYAGSTLEYIGRYWPECAHPAIRRLRGEPIQREA